MDCEREKKVEKEKSAGETEPQKDVDSRLRERVQEGAAPDPQPDEDKR
jgi:hypothetical protein